MGRGLENPLRTAPAIEFASEPAILPAILLPPPLPSPPSSASHGVTATALPDVSNLPHELFTRSALAAATATTSSALFSFARAVLLPAAVQVTDLGTYRMKGLAEGMAVIAVTRRPAAEKAGTPSGAGGLATAAVPGCSLELMQGRSAREAVPLGEDLPAPVSASAATAAETLAEAVEVAEGGLSKKAVLVAAGKGLLEEVWVVLPSPLKHHSS